MDHDLGVLVAVGADLFLAHGLDPVLVAGASLAVGQGLLRGQSPDQGHEVLAEAEVGVQARQAVQVRQRIKGRRMKRRSLDQTLIVTRKDLRVSCVFKWGSDVTWERITLEQNII